MRRDELARVQTVTVRAINGHYYYGRRVGGRVGPNTRRRAERRGCRPDRPHTRVFLRGAQAHKRTARRSREEAALQRRAHLRPSVIGRRKRRRRSRASSCRQVHARPAHRNWLVPHAISRAAAGDSHLDDRADFPVAQSDAGRLWKRIRASDSSYSKRKKKRRLTRYQH